MSAHEPPATVTLRFCAECGDMFLSQHEPHRPPAYHYNPVGGRPCRGATAALTYELRAEPQRSREEMIAAAAKVLRGGRPNGYAITGTDSRDAEAVLIAAGVIEAAPDAH